MQNKQQKSFSLLEVLITIFIITVGLIGALNLISFSMNIGSSNINKIIAVNLAQEGIEIVRNIRDNNIKQGRSYNTNIRTGYADYDDNSITSFGSAQELYLDNGKYVHTTGISTPFKRKIEIMNNTNYLEVKSIVEWDSHSIEIIDYLYDIN